MRRIILFLIAASAALPALAQEEPAAPRPLRVGVNAIAPFILPLAPKRAPQGYAADLWRGVAEQAKLAFEWVPQDGVSKNLDALKRGQVDIAVGGISVTLEREEHVDFSHSIYESGQGILVRAAQGETSWWKAIRKGMTRTRMGILLGFLALIVISGNLIWLAERGRDAFSDRYFPGVFEGMYWAIVTASTVGYGDKAPVKWAGRALAGLVIIISLPMFAIFTAELASAITMQGIESRIQGPGDLRGKHVAVLQGTTGADFAAGNGILLHQVTSQEDAYRALLAKEVVAVIYDIPALQHHAQTAGRGDTRVVGEPFLTQEIAFAIAPQSALRESIDRALLAMRENGEMKKLRVQWFGK